MPCGKLHRAGITAAGTEAGGWFESGRLVRRRRPAPVPVGAEGDEGSERQFRDGPREAPRLCRPAVGRAGRAGGGLGRGPGLSGTGGSGHGARGRAQPSDRQTCIRQALRRPAVRPSIQPAGYLGAGSAAAAGWDCPAPLGGISERERELVVSVWLQPCWGQ